ncbi:hypothetical protein ACJIZ3_001309 [Penstemon smallii]|uniref:Glycosyltransferase n=1 Tax=Penstemon smallii TaxID=265156 RepID=A0ABD3U395_9LAMI
MVDIARQFANHGMKSTIVTTPLNAKPFSKTIERDRANGNEINITLFEFPCREAGLPEGCESLSSTTTSEMSMNFFKALGLIQEPVQKILQEGQPDCIVAGAYFWWANDIAVKLNIPRLSFYGTGFFPLCIFHSLREHKPHQNVRSDSEEFIVPGLPDAIKTSRRQLPNQIKDGDNHPMAEMITKILNAEMSTYGQIVNSFYELEPTYAKHYKEVHGRKAWHIGPVSLFNKSYEDKTHRGREVTSSDHNCLSWLNSKKQNSVLFVCFGSMSFFTKAQLFEIAKGLEASGQQFIWAVRENAKDVPEEFERRMEGRGLIIKGWAPQVLILHHEAIGGFITHCGWNSLLEGVAAGVPMVTWPLSAEQFYNEKLVVEVLKTGIPVGAMEWTERTKDSEPIKGENIENAVVRLMLGEESETIRSRARKLGDMAKRAVQKGGSSDTELNSLLEEIRVYHL